MQIKPEQWMSWSGVPQMLFHQAAWWACVLVQGWLGPAAMAAFLMVHLWLTRSHFRTELCLVGLSALIGVGLDNGLAHMADVVYQGELLVGMSPLWLVAIWAGFGATVRHSQAVLFRSRWTAAATGLIGGPLAYWGGEKLGVLSVSSMVAWFDIGLLWMAAMLTIYSSDQHLR